MRSTTWFFAALEAAAAIVAFSRPLKDFLGIMNGARLSFRAIIGGLLCVSSGILLVLFESAFRFPKALQLGDTASTVFISMSDTSILSGLLIIMIGGILILLRSNTLGAAISIIFGVFPPAFLEQNISSLLPRQVTYHLYDFFTGANPPQLHIFLIGVLIGSLPIVGGLLALAGTRKIGG